MRKLNIKRKSQAIIVLISIVIALYFALVRLLLSVPSYNCVPAIPLIITQNRPAVLVAPAIAVIPAVSISTPQPPSEQFTVTAYTSIDDSMNGNGVTASGTKAKAHHTVAASKDLPFGTVLVDVVTHESFVVEDRGGAISRGKLDLYVGRSNRNDALSYGKQVRTFEIHVPN